MLLSETGLTPKPWTNAICSYSSRYGRDQLTLDMPPDEIWGTKEQATAFDLVHQLKEDQLQGDVGDAHIQCILGQLHILLMNHYKASISSGGLMMRIVSAKTQRLGGCTTKVVSTS